MYTYASGTFACIYQKVCIARVHQQYCLLELKAENNSNVYETEKCIHYSLLIVNYETLGMNEVQLHTSTWTNPTNGMLNE